MKIDIEGILDALPAKVWTALPDGRIEFVNRGWSGYSGLGACESGSWDWQALVDPDDLPELLERWQSILATGDPGDMEARVRRFDGQYRWHLIHCNPVRDDTGCIVNWYGVATDVDDLRRAEADLRRRELDFQSIVDGIPGLVAIITPEGETDVVNRQMAGYHGLTDEELKKWTTNRTIHDDDLPRVTEIFHSAIASSTPYEIEYRLRRFDGVYRWFHSRGVPLRDASGNISCWYALQTDIDDRKKAEEALRESERTARQIVDSIPGMVAVFGARGKVEGLNRQFLGYLGQTQEEFKNWATNGTVHPDDLRRHVEALTGSLESGQPIDFETRLRRFDGAYRWFQLRGHPARGADGRIVRWYCLMSDVDDRKRAEEAVAASERKLQDTIDTMPAMVWSARPDGTADFFNQHYLNYMGLSSERAQGWGWAAAVHPHDLNRLAATWQAILVSDKPTEAEARLRRHDGEYRWFLFRASALRDEHGRIVKWYGVNTDIEDRKRSEESFRAIVETTPECVEVVARDGTLLRTNAAGAVMAGVPSVDALVGQRFFDFVAPEHRTQYREFHEKICAGQKGFLEFDLISAQGIRRHMETHAAPMRSTDGSIVQLGVTRDITERKRAEEALKRSEAFLAEGQYLARMGSLSWHVPSGEIIWSEQLYRIFGFEPGTAVTLDRIAGRVYPEDMPLMVDMVERAKRGESDFEYQHRIVLPDQSVKHLHLLAHRARDHPDQVEYIGAVLDVTQRRLSEEALEKLRSELAQVTRIMSLGVLTASIAHEVNQPLSGIVTNAGTCLRMLAADPPDIEVARETARRTIRDGNRAADVIARLRALFSKRTATTEAVDLNEAVREVIALSSGDLRRNRVALRTELADELPFVGGDRIQLQQVIMNLLRNAADAMSGVDDRPRRLLVRTEPDGDGRVRLSVQDAGVGVGPEGAARLFEAFYTTKSDGMGIGLSVSRSIIESHSGRLWAQANDGPGATFSFSIPEYSGADTSVDEPGTLRVPAISGSARSAAGIS